METNHDPLLQAIAARLVEVKTQITTGNTVAALGLIDGFLSILPEPTSVNLAAAKAAAARHGGKK